MKVEWKASRSVNPRAPLGEASVHFGGCIVKAVVWPGTGDKPRIQWPSIPLAVEKHWTDKRGYTHKYDELVRFISRDDREAAESAVLSAMAHGAPAQRSEPATDDLPF